MTLLGLDFDNTLVSYDKLFYQLALEKDLIQKSIPANKIAIRDYLNHQGKDREFTLLQGEVYGQRILEAEPAEGMLEALEELRRQNIKMILVSHKTKSPYAGPAYDLRQGAINWLKKHNFFSKSFLSWKPEDIYFEETKLKKVKRIEECACTHYIDDLEEILFMLPSKIKKFHYNPNNESNKKGTNTTIRHWKELNRYWND